MELKLIELTDKDAICKTYEIYKHCMFMPTEEKFNNKIDKFLCDNSIKIFACLYQDKIKGVISVSFTEKDKVEIVGIAVDTSTRSKGIGSYMINKLVSDYGLTYVLAITDDDAVEFYRKCGFNITKFYKTHDDGETVVHYKCELTATTGKARLIVVKKRKCRFRHLGCNFIKVIPKSALSARKYALFSALNSTDSVYSKRVCGTNCGQKN